MSPRTKYCYCADERVPRAECSGCTPVWADGDDGLYSDPPLYPQGRLAGMTVEQLRAEYERQCDRQGRLGDAEYIDDRAVEEAEARCDLVKSELATRGARP